MNLADPPLFRMQDSPTCGKEIMLLQYLNEHYTTEIVSGVLVPLLTQDSPISLRALDWTVVNWSKQFNVVCSSIVPGKMTNIYRAYQSSLSFWKRKYFDPFRRKHPIEFTCGGVLYKSTLGQANFALFTYNTGIFSYVMSHIDEIEENMNSISRALREEKRISQKHGIHRKRRPLTLTTSHHACIVYETPMRVTV